MPGGGSVRVSPAPASSQTEPGQHRHQPPPASSLLSVLSEFLLLSVASPAQPSPAQPSPATSQCAKIVGAWCGRSQQPAQVFVEYLTRMCGASSGRPASADWRVSSRDPTAARSGIRIYKSTRHRHVEARKSLSNENSLFKHS